MMRQAMAPRLAIRTLRNITAPVASQIKTWTGVGLYALQGLFNCGQLLMSASTSISARISTYLPGSEMPSSKVSLPSGVTGTFMKKLILAVMSRFVMPWSHSSDRLQKAVAAGVHVALLDGIAHHVALLAQAPPERIVAAAGIGDDGQQRVAGGRHEPRARGEIEVALRADGVLRAVAIGVIVRVVEERIDGLIALQIDDAEVLAAPESRGSTARRPGMTCL